MEQYIIALMGMRVYVISEVSCFSEFRLSKNTSPSPDCQILYDMLTLSLQGESLSIQVGNAIMNEQSGPCLTLIYPTLPR